MPTITKTRERIVSRSKGAWAASLGADALTVTVGLGACVNITLIGSIPGSEIVLIALLPFLLAMRMRRIVHGRLKFLFLLLGLWLLGQVLTDIYRGTEFQDWARGDSAIVFMAMDLAGFAALISGSERRKAIFIFSFALGSLLATRISPNFFFAGAPWKFGYAVGVNSLVVLVSCWFFARRQYSIVGLLLLGIAGVNLFLDYRSPVLFLLVTIGLVLPLIPERIGRLRLLPPQGSWRRIAVLVLIVLTTGGIARLVLTGLAASGALGEEALLKNEAQANSTVGLLLGGRPEILVSSRAVWDSPILGHGSGAKEIKYREMYRDILLEIGIQEQETDDRNDFRFGIPAHSHLMQAWVNGGVLGGLFWGYVFVMLIRGTVRATVLRPALLPSYCFLLISFMWDVLFSPFGYIERIQEAFLLVVICDLVNFSPATYKGSVSGMLRRRFFVRPMRRVPRQIAVR